MFFAVSKSCDSLCAQSRFRDKKEKARTDCLLEFGVAGGTKKKRAGTETRPYKILSKPMSGGQGCFYCQVKAAICRAAARTGFSFFENYDTITTIKS